ncbi:site-specific integrase [uncultured Duncaniella sp.]|uniref:tyrosine-type recombinase/integrase n=1 Tax=uncultured Duncaniella sp. TaxID=2768039 RepID=UPI0026773405|nr:site-specific integrase [uncultured Duncaniella sp.]MCI9172006.1 site-specific integrase [Muribaculaceae bacterium]
MSKKMYPKQSHSSDVVEEKRAVSTVISTAAIRQYTPPVYKENGAGAYVEFHAFDPEIGKLRRKTIKINRINGLCKRRKYAKEIIARLNDQLQHGWNPWIAKDIANLITFEEGLNRYVSHIEKMMDDGLYRKETYSGYKSYVKILKEYISTQKPIYYMYQFDRAFCVDYLDWVFIDRNNGAQTRNNYLGFLRVFSGFLVEKGYLKTRPTEGIAPISKRLYNKERTVIPTDVIKKISEYCREREPDFLFACYLLYYSFIRPVEMTRLRVRHFNLKQCTLTIPGELSKNKKTQTVTIPKKVIQYGIEIGVFSAPMDDFIFSYRLKPGSVEIDPKHFRDHWENVRRALKLKKEWKFYSLKDTGITEMLKRKMAAIDVRDQARHSSLAITEIYTDHSDVEANKDILDHDGAL